MLAKLKAANSRAHGKTFAYVYLTTNDHHRIIEEASLMFLHENALNPSVFPSLRRMENEVVSMCLNLYHGGPGARGNLTSGGTESILMAVKTWRDFYRDTKGITEPNMIASSTVHPAFEKAAHYFNVEIVHVPCRDDGSADVAKMAFAVNRNTILLVASAPQYPHGVMDDVEGLSAVAEKRGIALHVDACVGGFMLPFVERLGRKV